MVFTFLPLFNAVQELLKLVTDLAAFNILSLTFIDQFTSYNQFPNVDINSIRGSVMR